MLMKLPPALAIARLLTDLVGRNVTARIVPGPAKPFEGVQSVAAYIDESATLRAVSYCDIAVGASLGAALVLIPPAVVEESIKAKELDASLAENLQEIFNVLASVFPQTGSPRVLLREVGISSHTPDDVKAVMTKSSARMDVDVDVAGYRSGRLSIMLC
jgi:hypothetical protein